MASTNANLTPPTNHTALTPSDTTDVTAIANIGIYVGVGGDVAVMGVYDSSAVTYKNVPAGTTIYGRFKRVMSTNTTATNIVGQAGGRKGP